MVDKYKHDVAWKELVNGSNGGTSSASSPAPSPDASLSDFTEPTPEPELQSPPPAAMAEPNETWDDPEFDEEDRIRAMDGFPDRATGADPHPPEEISVSETIGGDLMRIRILQDLSDPIIAEDGSEITLVEGDVESCPSLIAETLIAAGLAVAAPL